MAGGRHARPRRRRYGAVALIVVTVLAAAVAATAAVADDVRLVRAAVVTLAVLVVVPFAVLLGRSRDTERELQALLADRGEQLRARGDELRELRAELTRMDDANTALASELARLREQVAGLVAPVLSEPEPVYPSLHLPLVRAAFSEHVPPVAVFEPTQVAPEVPPDLAVDSGSEPLEGRRVLDLTAGELQHLRKASGA
jgi:hypothetical protein